MYGYQDPGETFTKLITNGTNCSSFESDIIVEKTKEIFEIGAHAEDNILHSGQMVWPVIEMNELPDKSL